MQGLSEGELFLGLGFLLFGLVVGLLIVWYTLRTGAPPMPSTRTMRRMLADLLPAYPSGSIIELGSGWGGLAQQLALHYPQHRVFGLELSPLPWLFSWAKRRALGPPNLRFVRCDFRDHPLHEVGLVVCYLNPEVMRRVEPWLRQGLAASAWVVCIGFALPGHKPVKTIKVPDMHATTLFLYQPTSGTVSVA
ncbi:conserved hypothetical protein [Magnetococcus marinus MC-1]|uniref:Methyltransferase domain-containing protein n=1 Tax=Magnetococcus marinus (strain ATCC BAA-1437 / JCM 17883 / MC-1) TaxID=156889 RepID=A0L7R7_MAGMM|nr:class I SAM-dependent methyltransferase [Magnetococcus marinus]ABK44010.1 conserved hypothetical protein [Magnetococcus marinus MC-1]